jgi:hypothetical protein
LLDCGLAVRRSLTPVEGRGITPITQVLLFPMGSEMKRPFVPSGPPIQLRPCLWRSAVGYCTMMVNMPVALVEPEVPVTSRV